MLFTNGFVFYGGLIGAVLAMWWYTHHFKMDFWQSVELLIPSVPLVHAFGRIGCFCGGCCYGIPFDPPIGIAFTNSPVAPNGIPLFPGAAGGGRLEFPAVFLPALVRRKAQASGQDSGRLCHRLRGDPVCVRVFKVRLRAGNSLGFLYLPMDQPDPPSHWYLAAGTESESRGKTGFGGASRGRRSRGKRISKAASRSALVPPQSHSLGPQKKGGQSLLHRKTPIFPGAHREDRCFCFQLRGKQMAIAVPAK